MKIIVDKLPENPIECVFSRINTGTRRCAHNAKICPLTRGEECPFLAEGQRVIVGVDLAQGEDMTAGEVNQTSEQKKRPAKRSTAKKAD